MTRGGLEIFLVLGVLVSGVCLLLFRILPELARSRFTLDLTRLHDSIEDAIIEKQLPSDDAGIARLLVLATTLGRASRGFTIGNVLCVHLAVVEVGGEQSDHVEFGYLDAAQQQLVDEYQVGLGRAVRRYFLLGSLAGWMIGGLLIAARLVHRARSFRDRVPTTVELVFDYEEVLAAAQPNPPRALALR